jgi:LVIVD repeat
VANIDNKGFSERIITAPVSPLGQKFYVKSRSATAVASPTTLGVDPTRAKNPDNLEGKIHSMYAYLYVTDAQEGLIVVGAGTLLDGDPRNNFLKRALTWNPDAILKGASAITIAGTTAYICADAGLILVSIDDPLRPKVLTKIGRPWLTKPKAVEIQFRYAFIIDQTGLKVADVTFPAEARVVAGASVPIEGANDVYVARTYAYVAAGKKGLAIVNVEKPEDPVLDQTFNAGGVIDDARQVKLGMINNSLFAYLADGKNGLRVIQLLSPELNPEIWGFSPRPTPRLIATRKTHGPALAVSKGLDRDRAVDESGNQLSVFGRRGARPFDLPEMRRLYVVGGKLMRVSDAPPSKPLALTAERSLEPPPLRLPEPKLIADEDFVSLVRRPAVQQASGGPSRRDGLMKRLTSRPNRTKVHVS